MATDHPNDPTPPDPPKPSPEEALFDDLPLSGTPTDEPLPPGSADELLVFGDAPPPVDPADALADLPLADPMEGSSGWLHDSATDPRSVDELGLLGDASDIFTDAGRSGSDVLRTGPGTDTGNSNIFTSAPGSSLFSLPTPPAGKAPDKLPGSDPDADLFEGLERSASGREGFPTRVGDPSSEVSLGALNGAEEDPASIFTPAPPGGPDVEINIAESALKGEDTDALAFAEENDPASHIFTNTKLPKPGEPPPTNESAVINWAEPGDWGDDLPVVANSATSETDALAAAAREELAAAPEPEPVEVAEPARPRSRSRVADAEPAARGGSRGWVGGGALGLLVGVGACAGAYFGGLLPAKSPPAVSQAPVRTAPPAAGPTLDDAHALLAAGDPGRALKAFDAAGDAATPEAKAARGQARWQARVRDLAATDTAVLANDPQLRQAEADLQAVLASADTLKTAPEKQAAVRAALHLGLLKELTGDPAAAAKVYTDAAGKFPASRRVFDTALARLRLAQPNGKLGRLLPRQAGELAQLAVVALLLIQQPEAEQPAADEEAGFRFWEAVNRAAAGDYANAIEAINQAKVFHDRRRLKLVGRGLNPLSDPLEQIFSRTCDDLRDYWTLKRELYGNPQLGPLVRKEGVPGFLAGVATLRAEANKSALAAKEAAGLKTANADLQTRLADAGKKLKTALATVAKTGQDKDRFAKELREKTKQLTDAEAKAAAALARQKAAETMLASAVKELKANNLIDAKDDAAAALAKLPAVLKRASAAATSADAQKAAQVLLRANTATEAARADAKNARAKADQLAAEMKKAEADAAKKIAAAQKDAKAARAATAAEVKKAVAAARSESENAKAQLARQAQLVNRKYELAQQEFARKLAEQEETFRRQMADVRAGVVVPLSAGERAAQYRATQSYSRGVELYFAGRYADAESAFAAAARDDATDARYWYFLGLSQFVEGKRESADAAFKRGAELEARNQPSARVLNAALERVQGAARQALNAHRP
jgi:hypothetical protein